MDIRRWDYGPLRPGEVGDYPEEIAHHAIRRSVVLDEDGEFIKYRVEPLGSVDKTRLRQIAVYHCSLVETGECDHAPFAKLDDLRTHMEVHFGPPTPIAGVGSQKQTPQPRP